MDARVGRDERHRLRMRIVYDDAAPGDVGDVEVARCVGHDSVGIIASNRKVAYGRFDPFDAQQGMTAICAFLP
jgi:hypothetical protein